MPGKMGMNAWLRKSNCHSSFPLFLPSLLHLQTDDRSKLPSLFSLHPSPLNHFSRSHIFILQISLSVDISLHLRPSNLFHFSYLSSFYTPLPPSPPPSDGFSPLFSFPFPPLIIPLSSSLQHSAQSIRCPSSSLLHPSLNPCVPSVVPVSPDFLPPLYLSTLPL